jgi:hypothetical protein
MLRMVLEDDGHKVQEAGNGKEALEIYGGCPADHTLAKRFSKSGHFRGNRNSAGVVSYYASCYTVQ